MQEVKFGTNKRMSFSKIKEVLDMPDLIEIQKNSYKRFLEEGLGEVLKDISPITDYSENLVLEFIDYRISDAPKYDVEECKERDVNYAAPLKVQVRLFNKETGEVKEQSEIFEEFDVTMSVIESLLVRECDSEGRIHISWGSQCIMN